VFSALPTFYMCSLKIPVQVINKLIFIEGTAYGARVTSIGEELVLMPGKQPVNQRIRVG